MKAEMQHQGLHKDSLCLTVAQTLDRHLNLSLLSFVEQSCLDVDYLKEDEFSVTSGLIKKKF